jgi:hypothetical protein
MAMTPFSCRHGGSPAAAALALSLAFLAAAAEPDSSALRPLTPDTVVKAEAAAAPDSAVSAALSTPATGVHPPGPKVPSGDTVSAIDSFNVNAGMFLGGGVGLSIGGAQVFTLWEDGLPASLADLGLGDTSFRETVVPFDTLKLAFKARKSPDVYNMMFPLSVSVGRLAGKNRYAAAVTFTMLSKNSRFTVGTGSGADSSIDISHSMGLYAVTLDLVYGRAIPDRYFSIDKSDRTDLIAGVSASPFIGMSRVTSAGAAPDSASAPRLWALRDSVARGALSVSASGIAFGWRLGIAKMRRLSKKGGLEGRLCWCGSWSTAFNTPDGKLTEKEISPKSGAPDRNVSYVSNRFEISVALIRKL